MIGTDSCEICGEGHVTQLVVANTIECGPHEIVVPMRMLNCDVCNSDYATGHEMNPNADRMRIMQRVAHVSGVKWLVECEGCGIYSSRGLLEEFGCLVCKEIKEQK